MTSIRRTIGIAFFVVESAVIAQAATADALIWYDQRFRRPPDKFAYHEWRDFATNGADTLRSRRLLAHHVRMTEVSEAVQQPP